jgi:hypothetical protein
VDELDLDGAHRHPVARLVGDELALGDARGAGNPRRLVVLYVDRAAHPLEEAGDALDGVTHHRAADVVRVVVGGEDASDRQPIGLDPVDEIVDGVRGIDQHALTGLPVTDGVDEVHHLLGDRVGRGEVPSGQHLAEVQPVGRRFAHRCQRTAARRGRARARTLALCPSTSTTWSPASRSCSVATG